VTDRQTDRQTQSHGWYRGCIASRGKNWAGFRHTRILRFILHCLMRKFEYLRNKGTFSETLRQASSIFVFRHDTPTVATSSHRASTSIYDTLCPWCKALRKFDTRDYGQTRRRVLTIGNESVPIQLAQCGSLDWPLPMLKYRVAPKSCTFLTHHIFIIVQDKMKEILPNCF